MTLVMIAATLPTARLVGGARGRLHGVGFLGGYAVVWKEGERFRMYYRGASQSGYTITSMLRPGESVIPEHPPTTC